MNKSSKLGFTELSSILFWTLLYRAVSVMIVIITLPMRVTLPRWMVEGFQHASYPLLLYSLIPLIFYKKTAVLLSKYLLFFGLNRPKIYH